jgi:hypothetical protein
MSKTASEYLLEALEKTGVKRVYGVVGDSLDGFTDALRRRKSIDWIHMRHELAMPPKATPDQAYHFGMFMMKAVLDGRASELVDLARGNLVR